MGFFTWIEKQAEQFIPKYSDQDDLKLISEIEQLENFRPVGETFNHLGVTCIVTAHGSRVPMVGIVAKLICDYVDKDGRINQICFGLNELPMLVKENPTIVPMYKEELSTAVSNEFDKEYAKFQSLSD